MLKRSNIPATILPRDLDKDNALHVPYVTHLLLPLAGPYTRSRTLNLISTLLARVLGASRTLRATALFAKRCGVPSITPVLSPLQISLVRTTSYEETFLRPLFEMSKSVAASPLARKKALTKGKRDANEAADRSLVLRMLSTPSEVMRDLHSSTFLSSRDAIITDRSVKELSGLASDEAGAAYVLAKVAPALKTGVVAAKSDGQPLAAGDLKPLILRALAIADQQLKLNLLGLYQSDASFKANLDKYVFDKSAGVSPVPPPGAFPSREWALRRFEELQLAIDRPFFRGPVDAFPVAPASRRTFSETASRAQTAEQIAKQATTTTTSSEEIVLSESTFQNKLQQMKEGSVRDLNEVSKDSTLLSSLTDERREAIDQAASAISTSNELATRTEVLSASLATSEYVSEGKDPLLATTELSFLVVAPVHATVHLEDVGIVWCPRIVSPFVLLQKAVSEYGKTQQQQYLDQHTEPPPCLAKTRRLYSFPVQFHGEGIVFQPFEEDISSLGLDPTTAAHDADLENVTFKVLDGGAYAVDSYGSAVSPPLAISIADCRIVGDELQGTIIAVALPAAYIGPARISGTAEITVPILEYDPTAMAALARQAATRSRAEQYGTLMRDEYAKRYDDPVSLCKEAFRSLLASILGDASVDQRSYYEELLGRCIDWATSKLVLEPAPADQLPYPEFLPDHFLNSPAARLFLPINREAEEIFFETLCQSGDQATAADARAIKLRLKQCRNRIDTLSTGTKEEKAKLVLDAYDTEIVIGKHLEAVVSRFEFSRDK